MEAFHWALTTCMEAFSEGTWYFAFALDSLRWDFLDEELRVPIRSVCDLFFIFSLLLPLLSSRFAVSCNLFFIFSQTWFSMLFFSFWILFWIDIFHFNPYYFVSFSFYIKLSLHSFDCDLFCFKSFFIVFFLISSLSIWLIEN